MMSNASKIIEEESMKMEIEQVLKTPSLFTPPHIIKIKGSKLKPIQEEEEEKE